MSLLRRIILSGLTLLGAFWLAGCATTVTTAPDPLKQTPSADQSVVVVSLTGNTSQVGAADSISVRRRTPNDPNGRETHILRQIAPGMARDTSLFIGTLPIGEYEFSSFDFSSTRQFLAFSDGMRARIGTFAVTGGKSIDLGRLLATPVNTSVVVGRSTRVTSNLELLRRFAPEYMRFFERDSAIALGWQNARSDTDRVEEYALTRSVGADNPFELADGSIVMGSRLGTALVRSKEGKWSVVRSDGLEALLCVRPGDTPEAHLVAVGEFGTLLRVNVRDNRFVKVNTGNLPSGNLVFIAGNSKDGWVIVQQVGRDIQFLRSTKLEGGEWTSLRKISLVNSFWSGNDQFWVWTDRHGLAYATSDGGLQFFNIATGQWTARAAPKGHRIIGVTPDQPDHIGVLTSPGGGFAGAFASQFYSRDGGATWAEMKTEFKIKVSAPRRAKTGELITMGGVFSNPELHASSDEGATWQKRSEFELNQDLSIMPSGLMLAVSRSNFGIFNIRTSMDHGKTWEIEYSNFDRAAYDAQQQKR